MFVAPEKIIFGKLGKAKKSISQLGGIGLKKIKKVTLYEQEKER